MNPHYKQVFNPDMLNNDPFAMPSDIKSPIALASDQS